MNYKQIRKMDISNGPGCRISLFVSGCEFHCPDCFNSEAWDFNNGKEFTDEDLNVIIDLAAPDFIEGVSILGGEPLHPRNIKRVIEICQKFKEKYPQKSIWIWTGYLFENTVDKRILDYADVIVDGLFQKELRDFTLKYKGSSNQRVIDVKKTQQQGVITLYED